MVQFCVAFIETLHGTHDKNLNIETEKSERSDSSTTCATKHFKDPNKNPDHAELLSLNVCMSIRYSLVRPVLGGYISS